MPQSATIDCHSYSTENFSGLINWYQGQRLPNMGIYSKEERNVVNRFHMLAEKRKRWQCKAEVYGEQHCAIYWEWYTSCIIMIESNRSQITTSSMTLFYHMQLFHITTYSMMKALYTDKVGGPYYLERSLPMNRFHDSIQFNSLTELTLVRIDTHRIIVMTYILTACIMLMFYSRAIALLTMHHCTHTISSYVNNIDAGLFF